MGTHEEISEVIVWHNEIDDFDYDLAVDWAMGCLVRDIETENVLILASFSKPVSKYEIKPYVTASINELGLEEKYGDGAAIAHIHFYLQQIVRGDSVRQNLNIIYDECYNLNFKYDLSTFFDLQLEWDDLEDNGHNYIYESITINNIEEIVIDQAKKWILKHIKGDQSVKLLSQLLTGNSFNKLKVTQEKNFWSRVKDFFNQN
ncbi:MAG: hypothetical protein AAF705_08290 [Bacteroidota bacterium]